MVKVALYVRVSRRDLNPKNQLIQLKKYCEDREWTYDVFEEVESTRKTRPIKQKVLNLLRKGKYGGVVIWKLDRWARSLQELIMDIDEITNKGKEFIVTTSPIDTTNASGRLFMQILGAFAEFEREIISERTKSGLERAKGKGIKLGRPAKDPIIYTHYCRYPGCRVKVERLRSVCDKHLKNLNRLKKRGYVKSKDWTI